MTVRIKDRLSSPDTSSSFSGEFTIGDSTYDLRLVYVVTSARTGRIAASLTLDSGDGEPQVGRVESGCIYSTRDRDKLLSALRSSVHVVVPDDAPVLDRYSADGEIPKHLRGWLETASVQLLAEAATA